MCLSPLNLNRQIWRPVWQKQFKVCVWYSKMIPHSLYETLCYLQNYILIVLSMIMKSHSVKFELMVHCLNMARLTKLCFVNIGCSNSTHGSWSFCQHGFQRTFYSKRVVVFANRFPSGPPPPINIDISFSEWLIVVPQVSCHGLKLIHRSSINIHCVCQYISFYRRIFCKGMSACQQPLWKKSHKKNTCICLLSLHADDLCEFEGCKRTGL